MSYRILDQPLNEKLPLKFNKNNKTKSTVENFDIFKVKEVSWKRSWKPAGIGWYFKDLHMVRLTSWMSKSQYPYFVPIVLKMYLLPFHKKWTLTRNRIWGHKVNSTFYKVFSTIIYTKHVTCMLGGSWNVKRSFSWNGCDLMSWFQIE